MEKHKISKVTLVKRTESQNIGDLEEEKKQLEQISKEREEKEDHMDEDLFSHLVST